MGKPTPVPAGAHQTIPSAHTSRPHCELAVIVPVFNERGNVSTLLALLDRALAGHAWEVIFVDDDSSDGTLDEILAASRADPRVRFVHRIGRRGLSTAVVEGMLSTSAPYLAVIDGDLQHDETKLPLMLDMLKAGSADIVVGTRYAEGGSVGNWSTGRQKISHAATWLAQRLLPTSLTDPMSGFFMINRDVLAQAVRRLSGQGYKILLDIVLSCPRPPRIAEVPYTFRRRVHGESKLDAGIVVDYAALLLDKAVGHVLPVRFILFGAVGTAGVAVHMAALTLALALGAGFMAGQSVATLTAMTFNFFLNNALTYRDKRLKGPARLAKGLLSFYAVCGLGAAANVGVASVLFEQSYAWWLSAIAGILVGVVWNYALTSIFTWRK